MNNIFSDESEAEAYMAFGDLRWPGKLYCPFCRNVNTDYIGCIETRGLFRCASCRHDFSVTTGTPFASLKLPFTKLMAAIRAYQDGVNRHAASKLLGVQYRTTHSLWPRIALFLATTADEIKSDV